MFTLDYYTLPNGRKPVEEFIDKLPPKMQASRLVTGCLNCALNLQAILPGSFTFSL